MQIYEINTRFEKILQEKMDRAFRPFGGSIELLPLCNMDCKMCYVKKTRLEMEKEGRMLDWQEWLEIGRQARDAGVLFLLLTGGEPLLYPHFKELYIGLIDLGLIVTVNTNATLLNEEWADFFKKRPCNRINITLYGKNDETYKSLCGNPRGFTQVSNAFRLLKERNIPFRLHASITKDNQGDLEELFKIAAQYGAQIRPVSYLFPAVRRGESSESQERMSPEEAAECVIDCYKLQYTDTVLRLAIKNNLNQLLQKPRLLGLEGYSCHAARSGFWINWKGEIQACGMQNGPSYSVTNGNFEDGWQKVVSGCGKTKFPAKCLACPLQNVCTVCVASLYAETGNTSEAPEYVCRYTENVVEEMIQCLEPSEQNFFRQAIRKNMPELIF